MRIGEYETERELARGGMGVVYLARGPGGEQVAIKLLLAAGLATPAQLARFRREAEALQALDHAGILRVQGYGVDAGRLYMVMDLVPGPTLAEVVKLEGRLPEARAIELARRMAAALGHAHSRGVVHRDLKPANVILHDGQPVLVDFGLVLLLGLDASRLTETGTIMGSPNYMAPEQATGEADVGPAADLYGLGATLYFLLTGRPPFEGTETLEVLKRVAGQQPLPLRDVCPELTPAVEAVVLRCLEKEPSQRYPTAFALEQALSELTERTAGVHGPPPEDRARYGVLLPVVLAVASLAALVVVLVSGLHSLDAQAWSESGDAKCEEGRFAEAIEDYSRAIELGPGDARGFVRRGIAKLALNRNAGAIEDFDRALVLDPESAELYLHRGAIQVELKRYAAAIADFNRALELGLEPPPAQLHDRRGASYMMLNRYEDAIHDFDRVLELEPESAKVYRDRGICKATMGRVAEAITDLDRALELDPQDAVAYARRGFSKTQLGRYAEAIIDLDRALELDPRDAFAYAQRGFSKTQLGRCEEAIEDYSRALEIRPRVARVYSDRGTAKVGLDRHAQAIQDFDRALELDPQDDVAYAMRGKSKAKLGRFNEAIEDYDQALGLNNMLPADAAQVRQLRADAAAGLNR